MLSLSPWWLLALSFSLSSMAAQTKGVGDSFVFVPGLGACGFTNTSQQIVASVSSVVFNGFRNATANPNKNPICHHKLVIKLGSTSVTAQIVDYYVAEAVDNVGLSSAAFAKLGDVNDGIIPNVTWSIV